MAEQKIDNPLTVTLGHEQLIIRRRYEVLSILNDFMVALWFLAGSILFLWPMQETLAKWFFVIGSAQFLVRPLIRLFSYIHIKRLPESHWQQ